MVDGFGMERVVPPVSPSGRVKGVRPEQGRKRDRNRERMPDKKSGGGPENEKIDNDNSDKDEDIFQGSRINICV